MVQVIDTGGSVAGRIGKGFGKGLAEQLPKEIQNYRTSSAIDKLRQPGNTDPLQQIQHLLRSGSSMQEIGALLPYIQKAQGITALNARAEGGTQANGQSPSQPQAAPAQGFNKEGYTPQGKGGFASEEQLKNLRSSLTQKPSQQEIDQLANKYIQEGLSFDATDARMKAEKEIEQNRASQQQQLNTFEKNLSARLADELQNSGLGDYGDVLGEIQRKLIDEGKLRTAGLGATPEQSSAEMSKIGKDLGRAATAIKKTGSFGQIDKPLKSKISEWKAQKKIYDDYGLNQPFMEIVAASSDLTPYQVGAALDPLENKKLKQNLSSLKTPAFLKPYGNKIKEQTLDDIVSEIKPSDNLWSIAQELRNKRYNEDQFFDKILEMKNNNQLALTDDQKRQIEVRGRGSVLGDFLFNAFR